ncbi:hypothetical protein BJV78DRAFT_1176763 [Lactifluus subvellereus]|nr:hypothetical protein BJV78DRAFT_1176763 [Lactifluus subvellereus]
MPSVNYFFYPRFAPSKTQRDTHLGTSTAGRDVCPPCPRRRHSQSRTRSARGCAPRLPHSYPSARWCSRLQELVGEVPVHVRGVYLDAVKSGLVNRDLRRNGETAARSRRSRPPSAGAARRVSSGEGSRSVPRAGSCLLAAARPREVLSCRRVLGLIRM